MSRLHEALKKASQSRGNGNGKDRIWEALDIEALDIQEAKAPSDRVNVPVSPEASTPPLNGHYQPSTIEAGVLAVAVEEREAEDVLEVEQALPPANSTVAVEEREAEDVLEQECLPEGARVRVAVEEREAEEVPGSEAQAQLNPSARLLPFAVNAAVVEHYRRLRTKILQQQEAKPFRTLVVTSAGAQEGKTVTVLNLALSFSTLPSFKVMVIDGDLRRGTLGSLLGVSKEQPGLTNLFDGSARLDEVVLKSAQIPVHFMVHGNAQVRDLHPSHFAGHFHKLSESFDLILIDSPPVNLLADVQLLAANSDAVLLVARAFSTTRRALEKAVQELAPFRLIGAVLNAGVTPKSSRYYGYY